MIPLLQPNVWSLMAPRDASLRLLAFPEGETLTRFERHGFVRSAATARDWRLEIDAERELDFEIQASLPFGPARVMVSGGRLDGSSYDPTTRVLRVAFSGRSSVLQVDA